MRYLSFDRKITFTKLYLVLNKLAMQKTNTHTQKGEKEKERQSKEIKFAFKSQIS